MCSSDLSGKAGVCYLSVADVHQFLCGVARRFYGDPSSRLRTVGITGTNGKTTITYLLESIVRRIGQTCGVIGTINYLVGGNIFPSQNTTPGLIDNQRLLAEMVKAGCAYCLMEVSSHALDQGRVDGIDFSCGVFTNLTSDHLDYHKTREEYFAAKALLFRNLSPGAAAVINADDPYAEELIQSTKARVVTYGIQKKADVMAKDIRADIQGTTFTLFHPSGEIQIKTKFIGQHNIQNIIAASAVAIQEKISFQKIKEGIEQLTCVPGRLEKVEGVGDVHVFIDYAHTEDALQNVLSTLRNVSGARITVVFGCGGDRDKTKRPKMGKVASDLADFAIVTNDNPRSEAPEEIAKQIVAGIKKKNFKVILNREVAIWEALHQARKNEIVLIAGKGHESYQIFKDKIMPFDEKAIVRHCMEKQQKHSNV